MELWMQALLVIGATVMTVVAARIGLPGRTLRMTYVDRRIRVVSTLLNEHRDKLAPDEIEELEKELSFIVDELLATSGRTEADRVRDWKRQRALKRLFLLPRPHSPTAWIVSTLTYVYLASALANGVRVLYFLGQDPTNMEQRVYGLIWFAVSLLLYVVFRSLSLVVARRHSAWRSNEPEAAM